MAVFYELKKCSTFIIEINHDHPYILFSKRCVFADRKGATNELKTSRE